MTGLRVIESRAAGQLTLGLPAAHAVVPSAFLPLVPGVRLSFLFLCFPVSCCAGAGSAID